MLLRAIPQVGKRICTDLPWQICSRNADSGRNTLVPFPVVEEMMYLLVEILVHHLQVEPVAKMNISGEVNSPLLDDMTALADPRFSEVSRTAQCRLLVVQAPSPRPGEDRHYATRSKVHVRLPSHDQRESSASFEREAARSSAKRRRRFCRLEQLHRDTSCPHRGF